MEKYAEKSDSLIQRGIKRLPVKGIFSLLAIVLLIMGIVIACENEKEAKVSALKKTQNLSLTQGNALFAPVFDWEDTAYVSLPGIPGFIPLPWYSGASVQAPDFILNDYRYKDGWVMLYNSCTAASNIQHGKYYLLFYNRFTGVLRVFFYNTFDTRPAEITFWKYSLSEPSGILNSVGNLAYPMDQVRQNPEVYVMNYSDGLIKSLSRGWNCFDVELSYDEVSNRKNVYMGISAFDYQDQDIELTEGINPCTGGVLVSLLNSMNPAEETFEYGVKVAGSPAEEFIAKKLENSSMKNKYDKLTSEGVAGLVKEEADFVFASFLGQARNSSLAGSSLKITTETEVKLKKKIEDNYAYPIQLTKLLLPGTKAADDRSLAAYNNALGVWNLETSPLVYSTENAALCLTDPDPHFLDRISTNQGTAAVRGAYHSETEIYLEPSSVKVKLNPAVLENILKYEVKVKLLCAIKTTKPSDALSAMRSGKYTGCRGACFFYDDSMLFIKPYASNGRFIFNGPTLTEVLPKGFFCRMRDRDYLKEDGGVDVGSLLENLVVKVAVTLYPKAPFDATPVVSTRTFKPVYGGKKGKITNTL